VGSSHKRFHGRKALLLPFKKILSEYVVTTNGAHGHHKDNTPEVTITTFRYSAYTFVLSGLVDEGSSPANAITCL